LPDPAELERMAKAFFAGRQPSSGSAGIGAPSPPASPNPGIWGPPENLAAGMTPSEFSIPLQSSSLGQNAVGAALPAGPMGAAQAPQPPVGGGTTPPVDAGGFAFLQQARGLFSEPATEIAGPKPFADPLEELVLQEAGTEGLLAALGRSDGEMVERSGPVIPEESGAFSFLRESRPLFGEEPAAPQGAGELSPPSPTVPGSMAPVESAIPTFSFMEEAKPLISSSPTAPGPVPAQTPEVPTLSSTSFDAETLRRDFPILRETVNGRPLVWLDNAATTQKPQSVIDRLVYFYAHENSNVHRAAHELAARATDAYESAREKIRRFLNASAPREIVFVRGATEGINLVAQSWGRQNIHKDDEIVITWLEHHANIVPWQMLCSETGARLRVVPVDDTGQVILEEYEKLLNPRTRLVSVAQVSNALGTVTPVAAMIESAHRHGARVLVDGAQAVSHMQVDVQALDCDFYVLSGHKMFAPTGIGVVYGKSEVLDQTPPWQGGGNMIQDVTFEKTVYAVPPARFEAGTGNIADAVGLGAAVDYLQRAGMANVTRHESELLTYGTDALRRVPGLRIIGTAREKAGVLSFVLDSVPTEEMGNLLNREGIAVRSGHHCAQPILRRFGLERTVRASLALYNTCEDLDALVAALFRITAARRGRG
jgi:cysteine desulfurase/selenocysteine lyase